MKYRSFTGYILPVIAILLTGRLEAQETDFDSRLIRETGMENHSYMPVIGFGTGTTHFFGEVRNSFRTPFTGHYGLKVNVSTPPIDRNGMFLVNFNLMLGSVTGNERSQTNLDRNLNFSSSLTAFGINLEYNFGHLFKKPDPILSPFISVGFAPFLFSAKGDLSAGGDLYYYWPDGTIRNMDVNSPDVANNEIMMRDWVFETDLREADLYGLGNYSQFSFALPLDVGVDFNVTDRVKLRLGTSFYMTFTDNIDNVSWKGEGITGKKGNDHFAMTYISMHLDLFSESKYITEDMLYAEMEDFDYVFLTDEDNDGILDASDVCLGTPAGIQVDTSGCPYDDDEDGIPNYLDDEINSRPRALVDDHGVEMTDDQLIALLGPREAITRKELNLYIPPQKEGARMTMEDLPEKFHVLDLDGDMYISFDELLLMIDDFFDYKSFMETEEIYQVINFFFAQ